MDNKTNVRDGERSITFERTLMCGSSSLSMTMSDSSAAEMNRDGFLRQQCPRKTKRGGSRHY